VRESPTNDFTNGPDSPALESLLVDRLELGSRPPAYTSPRAGHGDQGLASALAKDIRQYADTSSTRHCFSLDVHDELCRPNA
jgi:hypothetical protein